MSAEKKFQERGPKPAWVEVKRFTEDGLVCVVHRLKVGRGRSKYSTFVGAVRPDGTVTPNIGFFQVEDPTKVRFEKDYASIIAGLLTQAQQFIHAELEWEWHAWIENRIERETRSMIKAKPTRRTGKTARERAKKMGKTA